MRRGLFAPVALVGAALTVPLAGCGGGAADQAPAQGSVAVTTVPARRGSVTRWVTAYGSATAASNGTTTLSVNQPGQVTALMVTPGAMVRAGQPLVTFAVAPSALASLVSARTALTAAIRQRDTAATLLTQQLATRDQVAQADKAVADARAALDALRQDGAGQAVQTLRAPYDGIVTTIPVAAGDRTQPGAALATVARRGAIVVTVGIDPGERARIRPGAPARLTRLNGGAAIPGRVARIDGQLNPTTRLVDADIAFPTGAILSGEAMKVELASGDTSGWLVPHGSVVPAADQGNQVFQLIAGKAKAVTVDVLQSGSPDDVVAGPLDARRPVIVTGAYQVEDGAAVHAH